MQLNSDEKDNKIGKTVRYFIAHNDWLRRLRLCSPYARCAMNTAPVIRATIKRGHGDM
jgi:hypothetical protein